jgi:crotonobetainyl-CoA:carnitine CoA-transferase CaiB-like acyl-CoA transferase
VLALDEVFADPQVEHLQTVRPVHHERAGELRVLRHPVTLSDTPTGVQGPPPVAGRHTREVLAELGYSAADVDALVASGAVRAPDGG